MSRDMYQYGVCAPKTYHFIYNEVLFNAHFLLSKNNDEYW